MNNFSAYWDTIAQFISIEDLVVVFIGIALINFVIALIALRYPKDKPTKKTAPTLANSESNKAFNAIQEQIRALEQSNQELTKHIHALDQEQMKTAIVRFNPFRDNGVGGNQSFVLAHLNKQGNGFMITHYYSRELSRVSTKSISSWQSEQELSPEEKQAISELKKS